MTAPYWNTSVSGVATITDGECDICEAIRAEATIAELQAELIPLRRLRDALDSALEVEDGEWVREVMVNPPKWCAVMDALIASKKAAGR